MYLEYLELKTSIYNYRGIQSTELIQEIKVLLKEKKKKITKTEDELTLKVETFIKRNQLNLKDAKTTKIFSGT